VRQPAEAVERIARLIKASASVKARYEFEPPSAALAAALRAVVLPFLVSRALVWVGAELGYRLVAPAQTGLDDGYTRALLPFIRWDGHYYSDIARHWYGQGPPGSSEQLVRVAFFPLYPFLVRLLGGSDWALVVLPNVFFFGALVVIYVVARRYLEPDRAELAIWVLAFGPAAMFFSFPYSESLYLLLTAASFALLEAGLWLPAALLAGAGATTRVSGVLMSLAFWSEALRTRAARIRLVLAGFLPVAGLAAVAAIDWIQVGDPFAFARAQATWVSPHRNPLYPVGTIGTAILSGDPFRPEAIGLPVLILFAVAAVWVLRTMPLGYGAYSAALILLGLRQALYLGSFFSVPRYIVAAFPCYFAFAVFLAPRRNLLLAWLALSSLVLVVFSALYASWRFIG
jgi:hypothetical protein